MAILSNVSILGFLLQFSKRPIDVLSKLHIKASCSCVRLFSSLMLFNFFENWIDTSLDIDINIWKNVKLVDGQLARKGIMFLNIINEQVNQYKKEIEYYLYKTDNILEFCLIAKLDERIELLEKEKKELNRIIKKLKKIKIILNEVLEQLNEVSKIN